MLKSFAPAASERVDERGQFVELLAEGAWEAIVHGSMRAGAVMGNQYHRRTRVYFFVTSGCADVTLVRVSDSDRSTIHLAAGHGVYIEPGTAHAIRFCEPSQFVLAKSHRYDAADMDRYPYPIEGCV